MKVNFNTPLNRLTPNIGKTYEKPILLPCKSDSFNYLNLTDMKAITGKTLVNFHGVEQINPELRKILETESTKRIQGEYKWPDITDIKALMIVAETQTFMKVGGLAEVAVQLPDEFNKKMAGTSNMMQIMTPLYTNDRNPNLSVKNIDGKHYIYRNGNNEIQLEKVAEIPVETFDKKAQRYVTENVGILFGEFNCNEYIFLENEKYFNITPKDTKKTNGPYVTSTNETTLVERMIFFSKATYQLMKHNYKTPVKGFNTPNVIISNDWHTSPLSTFVRYVAPLENAEGKLDKKTYEYFKNTPIIHIAHSALYLGKEDQIKNDLLKMIFGNDEGRIVPNIKGYSVDGSPLHNSRGQYCGGLSDIYLADRIVAVSRNYADEITKSPIISGGQNAILMSRQNYGTMTGIRNGYNKNAIEPNEKVISSINTALAPEEPFIPFANMYNEEGYKIKMQNKARAISLLNSIAQRASEIEPELNAFENEAEQEVEKTLFNDEKTREQAYEESRKNVEQKCLEKYSSIVPGIKRLIQPDNCLIDLPEDISKVPFIASVGRLRSLKGYDNLAVSIKNIISNLKPSEERPIIAILGNSEKEIVDLLKKLKAEIADIDPIAAKRIFIFDGYNTQLRDAMGIGSDFYLIPSKWEACGLTQMEAMAKGSIPVATSTGGLVDTIIDGKDGFLTDVFYDSPINSETKDMPTTKTYDNGKFTPDEIPENNIDAFTIKLREALDIYYKEPEKIKQMAINAMAKDFSWDVPNGPLEDYIKLLRTGSID